MAGFCLRSINPDGDSFEMFRPLDNTDSTAALIDALRLYLVSARRSRNRAGGSIGARPADLETPG